MTEEKEGWVALIETKLDDPDPLISSLRAVTQIIIAVGDAWKATPSLKMIRKESIRILEKQLDESQQLRSTLLYFDRSTSVEYEVARMAFPLQRHNMPFADLLVELDKTIGEIDCATSNFKSLQKSGRPANERAHFCIKSIASSFQMHAPDISRLAKKSSLFYKVVHRLLAEAGISVGDLRHAINVALDSDGLS